MKKSVQLLLAIVLLQAVSVSAQQNGKKLPPPKGYDTTAVYMVVKNQPEFPGGSEARMVYIKQNMNYPEEAISRLEEGPVYIQFIVERDGSLSEIEILRGTSPLLDAEAMRLTEQMPLWEPGNIDGLSLRVRFSMPIEFSLKGKLNNALLDKACEQCRIAIEAGNKKQAQRIVERILKYKPNHKGALKLHKQIKKIRN